MESGIYVIRRRGSPTYIRYCSYLTRGLEVAGGLKGGGKRFFWGEGKGERGCGDLFSMHGVVEESFRRLALRIETRGGWSHLPPDHRHRLLAATQDGKHWQQFMRGERSWSFDIRRELSSKLIDWIPRLDEIFEDDFINEAEENQIEPQCQVSKHTKALSSSLPYPTNMSSSFRPRPGYSIA